MYSNYKSETALTYLTGINEAIARFEINIWKQLTLIN